MTTTIASASVFAAILVLWGAAPLLEPKARVRLAVCVLALGAVHIALFIRFVPELLVSRLHGEAPQQGALLSWFWLGVPLALPFMQSRSTWKHGLRAYFGENARPSFFLKSMAKDAVMHLLLLGSLLFLLAACLKGFTEWCLSAGGECPNLSGTLFYSPIVAPPIAVYAASILFLLLGKRPASEITRRRPSGLYIAVAGVTAFLVAFTAALYISTGEVSRGTGVHAPFNSAQAVAERLEPTIPIERALAKLRQACHLQDRLVAEPAPCADSAIALIERADLTPSSQRLLECSIGASTAQFPSGPDVERLVRKLLDTSDPANPRRCVRATLASLLGRSEEASILEALRSGSIEIKSELLRQIARENSAKHRKYVEVALKDPEPSVRTAAEAILRSSALLPSLPEMQDKASR